MKGLRTAGALAAVILLMLAYVWRTDRARALAAELDSLKAEQAALTDSLDRLRARRVWLSRVDRIKHIATTQLGLIEPEEIPVLVPAIEPIPEAESLDVATPPQRPTPPQRRTPPQGQ